MATKNKTQNGNEKFPTYEVTHNNTPYNVQFKYLPDITMQLDGLQGKNLTHKDIFQITAWKIDRYPEMQRKTLNSLNKLKTLVQLDEKVTEEVLINLLASHGIGLPVASAFLRFINPKVYQIIDVRAYRAAFDYIPQEKSYVFTKCETQIKVYLDYLAQLRSIDANSEKGYHGYRVAFENLDRFLYDVDKASGYTLKESPNPIPTEKDIVGWIEKVIHPK